MNDRESERHDEQKCSEHELHVFTGGNDEITPRLIVCGKCGRQWPVDGQIINASVLEARIVSLEGALLAAEHYVRLYAMTAEGYAKVAANNWLLNAAPLAKQPAEGEVQG